MCMCEGGEEDFVIEIEDMRERATIHLHATIQYAN